MGEVGVFFFLMRPNRLKMFQIFPMMSKGTHVIDFFLNREEAITPPCSFTAAFSLDFGRKHWLLCLYSPLSGGSSVPEPSIVVEKLPPLCSPVSFVHLNLHAIWLQRLPGTHLGLAFTICKISFWPAPLDEGQQKTFRDTTPPPHLKSGIMGRGSFQRHLFTSLHLYNNRWCHVSTHPWELGRRN